MGTDIHVVFQKRDGDKWIDVESSYEERELGGGENYRSYVVENRNYLLFAWLADVRNGFGFAGVKTHDPVEPIADQRGLPDDFELGRPIDDEDEIRDEYHNGKWMGDHSHSWLMLDEILDAKYPAPKEYGVLSVEQYEQWDKKSEPREYSGVVWGPNIVTAESPAALTPASTHVCVEFQTTGRLDYFIDEIKRLKALHGEVRMVFGFDS